LKNQGPEGKNVPAFENNLEFVLSREGNSVFVSTEKFHHHGFELFSIDFPVPVSIKLLHELFIDTGFNVLT
jgi:hypothetical protein